MKQVQEQFKIELVLRDQTQMTRKLSADYRYRDRPKDHRLIPATHPNKLRATISYEREKTGCINAIFSKEREEMQFSEKCMSILLKKKINQNEQQQPQNASKFNTMLQNIKNVIKENEKKDRKVKLEAQPLYNNQFQCVRSQIHQIYQSQEKVQLYRMLRNCQSRNGNRKDSVKSEKTDKPQRSLSQHKPLTNPFFNQNTIVCFTMALNEPNQQQRRQQNLFEAPIYRHSVSGGHRRIVQISKPTNSKSMMFNLNRENDGQYARKLKNFFDFLFKVNYANNIYVSLQLLKPEENCNYPKYKCYIGKGNNSLLIKSLIKRRFWWDITDSLDNNSINFYWTQNIIDKIQLKQQKANKMTVTQDKLARKRKQTEEFIDMNRKILPLQKAKKVQSLITKQGYTIPFEQTFTPDILTNHLPRNYCIGSKKNLFKSLFHYFRNIRKKNPFDYIPKTYHIKSSDDIEYRTFVKENQMQPDKVWIVKPGENSNRGRGIRLSTFQNISQLIKKSKHQNGLPFTYIVQSYINRPFLYNNRKFDIRHYMMLTSTNGIVKAYWYKQGYIRTSSEIFDLEDLDNQFIHLTNDAIQRNSQFYQKYQPANKLSYSEFQRYLDYNYPFKNYHFEKDILPKIKEMATYIIKANYQTIDHKRHKNNFEIYGLDFMIDKDFKPWLIQVNYNPCLEINCPILERIIPVMLENTFRLALDPLFPPPSHFPASKRFYLSDNYLKNLKYQLIFDEDSIQVPINNDFQFVDEKQTEQEYQDEGKEITELNL